MFINKQKKSILIILLTVSLCLTNILCLPGRVSAGSAKDPYDALRKDITHQLIFSRSEKDSRDKTASLLKELRNIDPESSRIWEQILPYWDLVSTDGFVNTVDLSDRTQLSAPLPDDLPDDNSLCIIVLGFALNPDGTMKDELISRLSLGLACAQQYPNAFILVTGGATAAAAPELTEADCMADWFKDKGITKESGRLIVENRSKTTVENAVFSYEILRDKYPQVKNAVIVTSDYHAAFGCLLFQTRFLLAQYRSASAKNPETELPAKNRQESLSVVANAGVLISGPHVISGKSQSQWMWTLVSGYPH